MVESTQGGRVGSFLSATKSSTRHRLRFRLNAVSIERRRAWAQSAKSMSHPSPALRESPNGLVVLADIGLGLLVVCGIGIGIISASKGGEKTAPPIEGSGEQFLREFKVNEVEANKK
jgi:hypothetical protein